MAYEKIAVRMNRSSSGIPWGFHVVGGSTLPIRISTVEKESLAYKAGLQEGDIITEFSGRAAKGMSLDEARSIVEGALPEIHLLLQRQVTEHSCIPWELTEKNNQVTVDHIKPYPAKYNYNKESSINRPLNPNYQPIAPLTNVTNTESPYAQSKRIQDVHSVDGYRGNERPMPMSRNVPITLATSAPSSTLVGTPISCSSATDGKIYHPVHVDTSAAYRNIGYPSSVSGSTNDPVKNAAIKPTWQDTGPRIPFQHSPRTERQLSPHATVRHLQYGSPLNLYSPQSAAEQYIRQTGGLFGTDSSLQRARGDEVYLKSKTRRLIAEEEGQSVREKSPSMQSASFKRISRACGTPVD